MTGHQPGGVELGVYTVAELRGAISPEQRVRDLMEEIELAAAAVHTKRIRLTSAVTVRTRR